MRRPLFLLLAGVLLVPIAAWSQYDDPGPGPGPGGCSGHDVEATANFTFEPPSLTVQAGATVDWCNASGITHTVTADDASFGFTTPSDNFTYSFKFDTPGTYPYHCNVHPGMDGTILVEGSASQPGNLRFSSGNVSVGEGAGNVSLTVQRVNGDDGAVSVNYATANGTATAGSDYTATSGTLNWANNDDDPKSFTVPILDDSVAESNETFSVSLSGATGGATLTNPSSVTVTIVDNDSSPGPGTAPAAPSNLAAAAVSTSDIRLTWKDNSNNESQFLVEERPLGGSFAQIGTAPAGATEYTRPGLPAATHRDYRVRSSNSVGNSAYSNIAGASTDDTPGPCTTSGGELCINSERFKVEVDWRTSDDSGQAVGVPIPSAPDSGALYFFGPSNLEMLIKVLNACGFPAPRYWVFYAATTNVEFTVTVTDTQSGKTKVYFNPLDNPAPPVQDTSAFATCP